MAGGRATREDWDTLSPSHHGNKCGRLAVSIPSTSEPAPAYQLVMTHRENICNYSICCWWLRTQEVPTSGCPQKPPSGWKESCSTVELCLEQGRLMSLVVEEL